MNLVPIASLDDPRVRDYASIRDAELAQRADPLDPAAHRGLFVAEGELVVRRLIGSPFPVVSVLTTPTRLATIGDALQGLPGHVPVYLADQPTMNAIVGFNIHRGLLAIGGRAGGLTLDEILARPGPFLILEDLVNHDNLGGIFRNAAALGGPGVAVLLSPRCADPLYRKSLRVSVGHVLSVPFARLPEWEPGLEAIRAAGVELWALSPRSDALPLRAAAAGLGRRRAGLLLGSEGPGLTDAAFAKADRRVRIPMHPVDGERDIDSLNVAMAAGVALYELGIDGGSPESTRPGNPPPPTSV